MRRLLVAGLLAGAAFAPAAPASADHCGYRPHVKPVGCVPSECLLVHHVVQTVNRAAGEPLPPGFPHCID